MKYIRTKDGRIIDLEGWLSVETICVNTETDEAKKDICYQRTWFEQHGDACEYKTEYISRNTQVLKEADTIEELCDEFVVYEEDQPKPINMPLTEKTQFEKMKEIIKLGLKTKINCWLKLAIWTDKGLIYVAKMNKEGELKLL